MSERIKVGDIVMLPCLVLDISEDNTRCVLTAERGNQIGVTISDVKISLLSKALEDERQKYIAEDDKFWEGQKNGTNISAQEKKNLAVLAEYRPVLHEKPTGASDKDHENGDEELGR